MSEVGYMAHRQKMLHTPDIDYDEWWQYTHLSESNTLCERLWFKSTDTDTTRRQVSVFLLRSFIKALSISIHIKVLSISGGFHCNLQPF